MAKPDTWMPLYIGDYLKDTGRLTTEQHGSYLLLLMDYWVNGPPPDDDEDLAAITKLGPILWRKQRPRLLRFFSIVDGRWRQKRLDEERERANHISSIRSEAGAKGGRPRKQVVAQTDTKSESNEKPNAKPNAEQTETHANVARPSHAEVGVPSETPTISTERGRADERAGGSSSRRVGTRRSGEAVTSPAPRHVWLGPPEVREAVVRRCGEDFTASYLDPCVWREEHQAVVPKTSVAATRLSQDAGQVLRDKGLKILRTDPVMFPNGVVGEHAA